MNCCEIKPFKEKYVIDAARLFAGNYRAARDRIPILPSRYEDANVVLPLLNDSIRTLPGVVAIENGKPLGYLIGRLLRNWRGRRSVFVPFWGHAVAGEKRRKILEQMYVQLSKEWIMNGCFTHLVSMLVNDTEIIDTLFWLGFGMAVVDTMRDFSDMHGPVAGVEVRRANLDDLDVIVSLDNELARYLAGPPTFVAMTEKRSKEYHEEWLSKSTHALWLASDKGEVVAYMKICPFNEDYVITDEKTAWIQGAYTKERLRGKGIGTTLLKRSLDWAQSQGYERCAVDFESENVLASAFWTRYFQPVCFSLSRQIDKRIAWAHKDRKDNTFW